MTRLDFGGAFDAMDSRVMTLFEQIGAEKRRDLDDEDDVAQARRAEALSAWHAELADIFERAGSLADADNAHPMEITMAHQAALLHNSLALTQATLGRQHRARAERHRKANVAATVADPFALARVHEAARRARKETVA